MHKDARRAAGAGFAWALGLLLFIPSIDRAEQLPIKVYTTADGLARDNVNRIICDSTGFLWFCTDEGLSRFDGYQFTNYTTDQGLPHRKVNDLLETRGGSYWVATGGGLCQFNPAGAPQFRIYHLGDDQAAYQVYVLAEESAGVIWCGTNGGLYRLEERAGETQFQFVEMGMPKDGEGNLVQALVVDRQDTLWAGTRGSGLYRRWPDGHIEHYTTQQGLPDNRIEALLEDRDGRLWAGTPGGLCLLVPAPDLKNSVVARLFTTRDGLADNWIESLFQSEDGDLWIGNSGLSELTFATRGASPQIRTYTTANGLSSYYVQAMADDRYGNLWIGTDSGGVMKLARRGFTTYTEADGLAAAGADAIFENRAGELCVISSGTRHFLNRLEGRRFRTIWPAFPKPITNFGWGWNQVTLQDHTGEWWMPTGQGLCRFPAVGRVEQLASTRPKTVYTTRDGLPFNDVFRLYEDSCGNIWIATISARSNGLSCWERASGRLHSFSEAESFSAGHGAVTALGEDAAGGLWIGYGNGGLVRYAAGRFRLLTRADGLPEGAIRSLYLDHARRLWIASSLGGLARLDNPAADSLTFVTYTTLQGLSSNDVWCITEGRDGHIYFGTGRGLDRLDPETGHLNHYTAADGLMRGKVTSAFRDHNGVLWFGSNVHGLSQFIPGPEPAQTPPPILISGLRISGVALPLSQLGETTLPQLDLSPNQNQVTFDFVGLSYSPGEALRYQYRLEGADRDWSLPGLDRSVNYANLAPGRYRFWVRAVNDEGVVSSLPASASFTILPPVWRRWWFLMMAAIGVGAAIYAAHRQRVARLVELERVRTRIATDLHDDIGANLSLIAMLSEVARGHLPREDLRMKEWFSTIATTSRETVDAMSDIVWAVNPRRDQLRDLIQRMRRFADDFLGARNVELHFQAADSGRDVKVGADVRREVFLIFKESINNMARHSHCTRAFIQLEIERGWLVLQMRDNGRGCDPTCTTNGNGLASMRLRARKLGGEVELLSSYGQGTSVTLRVPLDQRSRA